MINNLIEIGYRLINLIKSKPSQNYTAPTVTLNFIITKLSNLILLIRTISYGTLLA